MSAVPRRIAVVGGGLAGLWAVETLRREGYDGSLFLIGDESDLPYDRPPLSKDILLEPGDPRSTELRAAEVLAEQDVEVLLGVGATRLDLAASSIDVDGRRLSFDGLIVATGASARMIPQLGVLPGVHALRTRADALNVRAGFESARHVVVVGAGFIGAEVAASARRRGLDVTIVELERVPLARVLGPELGGATADLHREHGTDLRLGVAVIGGEHDRDGTVHLRLSDGSTLAADLVVVGVGVQPNTGWLEDSGLEVSNGVVCDTALNAGPPGVFAVGDVASWPNPLFGRRMRVEHWTNAIEQARHAARNLLAGTALPFAGSNYFWSDQYGVRIQFAGVAASEYHMIDGDAGRPGSLAWFVDGERLVGALAIDAAKLFMKSKRLIEARAGWQDARGTLEASAG